MNVRQNFAEKSSSIKYHMVASVKIVNLSRFRYHFQVIVTRGSFFHGTCNALLLRVWETVRCGDASGINSLQIL
jgi:hypothetical protein